MTTLNKSVNKFGLFVYTRVKNKIR